MNYHNITKDDMKNGDGLRAVLWVSGCNHKCFNCQNPETWDPASGITFDAAAEAELMDLLALDHISGVTFSGGDPLHPLNRGTILDLCKKIKAKYPQKTIWIYTGYTWEAISSLAIMQYIDVLVDARFDSFLADVNFRWAGSTNQRVIDVKETLRLNQVVLHANNYSK